MAIFQAWLFFDPPVPAATTGWRRADKAGPVLLSAAIIGMQRIPVRTGAVANNTLRAAGPIGQHSERKSFSMAPHDPLSLGIDIS